MYRISYRWNTGAFMAARNLSFFESATIEKAAAAALKEA